MRIHVLQHVPFEGLGSIAAWAAARSAEVGYTRFFDDAPLPALDGVDLLIALGGPMSVNDEASLPWLANEKQLIREAIARRLPVLGVCLGAQLIASALGARVYRQAEKEIGWFPVASVPGNEWLPRELTVFHWHGETFDLPPGAVRLASSTACLNQAYQLDGHVIGLQFHLEATPETVKALAQHCLEELVPGTFIQAEAQMLGQSTGVYESANLVMDRLLTRVMESAAT